MNRNPKYQKIPFPMFPLVLWWWNKGQLGSWRREQLSEALASWCTSSSVTKWLFLCAAALTDILHCTVYSPNSRKLQCRVQRPAGAGGGCWLAASAPGNSRVNGAPWGCPRPLTSAALGGRTRWRVASCAGRLLPVRARVVAGAGPRTGILVGTFRWAASFRNDFDLAVLRPGL